MRNKVTSILRNSKQSFFSRNINTGNKNRFWKTMKLFREDSAAIPSRSSLMVATCADNELDNANMLYNYYNYFSKCFTTSLPPLYGSFDSAEHLELPKGGPENLQRRRYSFPPSNMEMVEYSTPIPKSGDKASPANYRPVSLLSILSKRLERHIVNLLLQHLMETQPISFTVEFSEGKVNSNSPTGNYSQLV